MPRAGGGRRVRGAALAGAKRSSTIATPSAASLMFRRPDDSLWDRQLPPRCRLRRPGPLFQASNRKSFLSLICVGPQHRDRDCGPDSGRDLPALISSPIDCFLKLKKFRFIQQFIYSNFLNRSLLEANCLNLQLMDHFEVNLFMEPGRGRRRFVQLRNTLAVSGKSEFKKIRANYEPCPELLFMPLGGGHGIPLLLSARYQWYLTTLF